MSNQQLTVISSGNLSDRELRRHKGRAAPSPDQRRNTCPFRSPFYRMNDTNDAIAIEIRRGINSGAELLEL